MPLPPLPESFRWTEESWGAALRCIPLDRVASHLFSTRQLASTGAVADAQLAAAVEAETVVMVSQVHGNRVVAVRDRSALPARAVEADALSCDVSRVAIAVRAADCVPLLMADRGTGAVAAVHAGWRGTAAGIAPTTVAALQREFATRPEDLIVAIGPSIGPCCYEVGSDLVDAFAAAGHQRYLIDRWFTTLPPPRGTRARSPLRLDVAGANRDQLVLAGVPEDGIFLSGLCTAMHLDVLTSFRAEKERAVRLVGAITPKPL